MTVAQGQPLTGIKVLDFTTLLPGPLAGLLLAEAGADVIKIERPEGEDARYFPPFLGEQSAFFALLNAGKRNVSLNLKDEKAIAALKPLLAEADVLIEQFRPGVMDRLGLGYDDCRAINPQLIYCSITGYGATGAKADVAGHDLNYIGDTGLLSLNHGPADRPTVPPALIADIAGGSMPAVLNILLALIARQTSGAGCRLDIAMSDAMFMFSFWAQAQAHATGIWPKSGEGMLAGGSPRYQLYPTGDGRLVAVAALEQKFWMTFCHLIGLPENLRNDLAAPHDTLKAVAAIIAAKPAAHWRTLFEGQDCCCSIVASLQEAWSDSHFAMRGLFDYRVSAAGAAPIPALCVPVAAQFRGSAEDLRAVAARGADNECMAWRKDSDDSA